MKKLLIALLAINLIACASPAQVAQMRAARTAEQHQCGRNNPIGVTVICNQYPDGSRELDLAKY